MIVFISIKQKKKKKKKNYASMKTQFIPWPFIYNLTQCSKLRKLLWRICKTPNEIPSIQYEVSLPTLLPIPAILRKSQHTHLNPTAKSPKIVGKNLWDQEMQTFTWGSWWGRWWSLPREPIHVNFCRFLHPLPNPLPHSHLASNLFFNSNFNTVTHLASHLHVHANSVAISRGHV